MMFSRSKVEIGEALAERAKAAAAKAGYSSLEEFVRHSIEKELARLEEADDKDVVTQQLKGLGYLE